MLHVKGDRVSHERISRALQTLQVLFGLMCCRKLTVVHTPHRKGPIRRAAPACRALLLIKKKQRGWRLARLSQYATFPHARLLQPDGCGIFTDDDVHGVSHPVPAICCLPRWTLRERMRSCIAPSRSRWRPQQLPGSCCGSCPALASWTTTSRQVQSYVQDHTYTSEKHVPPLLATSLTQSG